LVTEGGLIFFGIDQAALYRLAASYVDRILKGEKPADLAVQAPTKYKTVLNIKTAKALGDRMKHCCTCSRRFMAQSGHRALFDYLVGAGEQAWRDS
jgi:ABC-type uncharacterized transport system substrate-binding protein